MAVSPPSSSSPRLLQRATSSSVTQAALLPRQQRSRQAVAVRVLLHSSSSSRQPGSSSSSSATRQVSTAATSTGGVAQRQAVRCRSTSRSQQEASPTTSTRQVYTANPSSAGVVQGVVSLLTEALRLLGVGRTDYQRIAAAAPDADAPPPAPGDVAAVLARVQADFEQRSYFITGLIDGGIYDPQCTFKDPTVSFSGLDLWRRNLQLLVPFLIEPRVQLLGLRDLGLQDQQQRPGPDSSSSSSSRRQLEADWTLQATLALPWRPFVDVLGRTVYTLNADETQVVEHVEFWNITPVQALLQVVTPGGRSRQRSK